MDLLKIFRSLGWSGMGNGTEQLSFNIFFTLVKKRRREKQHENWILLQPLRYSKT